MCCFIMFLKSLVRIVHFEMIILVTFTSQFNSAEERQQIEARIHTQLTQEFEKRLESEIENSQKHWSGSTNVSTLCILEVSFLLIIRIRIPTQ